MKLVTYILLVSLILSGCSNQKHLFSEWLTLTEIDEYMQELDGDKPGGKNFWDRGHRITAAEGRWKNGIPQYRIAYEVVPPSKAHWWFWYINQDQKSFDKHVHRLADDGYTLVYHNSYIRPGGSERFQGVWHKLIPRNSDE